MTTPSLNLKDRFLNPLSSFVLSTDRDIRYFVIGGIALQLLFWRSRRMSYYVMFVVYVIADVYPKYIMALIVQTRKQAPDEKGSAILMFWAPFLILHWSGPDHLTALSSGDNELWSRSAIQLASMVYAIAGTSYHHGSVTERKLRLPALLIFIVGLIKFLERIMCNYTARLSTLKESLVQQKTRPSTNISTLQLEEDESAPERMVRNSHHLFESFKRVLVDLPVPIEDQQRSRHYFLHKDAKDAFKILRIELNVAYDLFFSKAMLFRHRVAHFFHLVSIICVVSSLVIWYRIHETKNFFKLDIGITYAILVAAVFGEIFSFWKMLSYYPTTSSILRGWRPCQGPLNAGETNTKWRQYKDTPHQLNFFYDHYQGHRRGKARYLFIMMKTLDDAGPLVHHIEPSTFEDVRCLIYEELKDRAEKVTANPTRVVENTSTSKGVHRLLANYKPRVQELSSLSSELTTDKTYDETLLLWHIATTLCYSDKESSEIRYREFSRVLSDYMLYLVLDNPKMMSEVAAMGKTRHKATLDEAVKNYSNKLSCTALLQRVSNDRERRDQGNSVLYAASRLAAALKEMETDQMWELIGNMWVEMLCYAAVLCNASAHVDQLPKGREFLTEVWLLMEHLGLGKHV